MSNKKGVLASGRQSQWVIFSIQELEYCGKSTIILKYICRYLLYRTTRGIILNSKNITLPVNFELYDKYRQYCKKEGWIVSRQFEKLMECHLESHK